MNTYHIEKFERPSYRIHVVDDDYNGHLPKVELPSYVIERYFRITEALENLNADLEELALKMAPATPGVK